MKCLFGIFITLISLKAISATKYKCTIDVLPKNTKEISRFMLEGLEVEVGEKTQSIPLKLFLHLGVSQGDRKPYKWTKVADKSIELRLTHYNNQKNGLLFMLREGFKVPLIESNTDFNSSFTNVSATVYPSSGNSGLDGTSNLSCKRL